MLRVLTLIACVAIVFSACRSDGEPLDVHVALHGIARDACERLDIADSHEAPGIINSAIDAGDEIGASEVEVREVLEEECLDRLSEG